MFTRILKFHGIQKFDSNVDKAKLYESVRRDLAEIYEDESEAFRPASVGENPCKDLDDVNEIDLRKNQVKIKTKKGQIKIRYSRVQEGVKNLRQKFSIYSRLLYFNPGWNFS